MLGACRGRPGAADWAGAGHTGAPGPGIQVPLTAQCARSAIHAAVSNWIPVLPAAWASFSCLPAFPTVTEADHVSWGILLRLEQVMTWQ